MGTRALEQIFTPSSVAVIGASDKLGSLGGAVLRNLLQAGFAGPIYPVNARGYKKVGGLKSYARNCQPVSTLPLSAHLPIALIKLSKLWPKQGYQPQLS